MNEFLDHFKSLDWWLSAIVLVIILELIGHFLFHKYIDKLFERWSQKRKYKAIDKRKALDEYAMVIADSQTKLLFEIYRSIEMKASANTAYYTFLVLFFIGMILIGTEERILGIISFVAAAGSLLGLNFFNKQYRKSRDSIESAEIMYDNKVDLSNIFTGKWQLVYSNDTIKETETVEVKIGNRYLRDDKYVFNLKNVVVFEDRKTIRFDKVLLNGTLNNSENLIIIDEKNIEGTSTSGVNLHYKKIN